ncbi:MAG: NAD-dependent dihydropyrimidine dehydrogenase subunit PreA [Erysipelotrichaceae bacterium]|nr:NAD-dependent dihydropyrimidine dehydrogenase subunit PreA [Erysipelotrichaceae bacterium]
MFERIILRSDMLKCALCHDAPCSAVCKQMDPDRLLRSIWFDNEEGAAARLPDENPCVNCQAWCEQECVRSGEVPVRKLIMRLYDEIKPKLPRDVPSDNRLASDFCGIPMENPFMLSSSVVASTYDMCARAFDAGWGGICFKTICNFEIHEASPRFSAITGDNGSIIGFKNIEQLSDHSAAENMEVFRKLKQNYPSKFILASIMGRDDREWEDLARMCQENGADAIELNFSCPNMMDGGLGSDIGQVPELVERFTAAARRGASIPILAKLTPNVSEMNSAAKAAKRGGADGIAAINTIKSVIGINPYTYVSSPAVHGMSAVGGYSGNAVKPIALRFIDDLGSDPELDGMHLSAMGGIETWADALEFIMVGADSLQVTTAVMQYGYRIIDDLKDGLNRYMNEAGFHSISEMSGLANDTISDTTDVIERDTVIYPVFHKEKCIRCGRCMVSCMDGGHQAITLNGQRRPILNGLKCVGCHLCILVCPQKAISPGRKRVRKAHY